MSEEIEQAIDKYIQDIINKIILEPPNKTKHCPVSNGRCIHFDIELSGNCENCINFKTWLVMKREALKQNILKGVGDE